MDTFKPLTFKPLTIDILAGGVSHEREVSLRSGRRLAGTLSALGHRVRTLDPDADLLSRLATDSPDVVWPVLHGATGEDGSLLALLEISGIPFVGPREPAARLAWMKPVAKALVERAGYETPRSHTISRETFRDFGAANVLGALEQSIGIPLVVKPASGGSAQGVTLVAAADDLPRAMVNAYTYSDSILIESWVAGTEVAATVIDTADGPLALPLVEIEPLGGVYGYEARYVAGDTLFYTPARLQTDVAARVSETAVAIHTLLGLRHLSRIDLIVDGEGVPWFLEANVLPGLTETSLVPQAIRASGRPLGLVYDEVLRTARTVQAAVE